MFDRDKVVTKLIEDDINSYHEHGFVDTLWYVLAEGFKGYNNFSDDELLEELKERDIQEMMENTDD